MQESAPDSDAGLAGIEAELDFSPADVSILTEAAAAPSPSDPITATLADHEQTLNAFMAELNSVWSDRLGCLTNIQPYFMLPAECWQGQTRTTLVEILGLAPTQPWNVLPLGSDVDSVAELSIGRHPGGPTAESITVAQDFVDEILGAMHATFDTATFGGEDVDTEALARARQKAVDDIIALGRHVAGAVLGKETVNRSRQVFFGD